MSRVTEGKKKLGDNLMMRMKEAGYTRHVLSEKAHIPYATLCDWFAGRTSPGVDKLIDLADCLGCSPSDFFVDTPTDNLNASEPKQPQEDNQAQPKTGNIEFKDVYVGIYAVASMDEENAREHIRCVKVFPCMSDAVKAIPCSENPTKLDGSETDRWVWKEKTSLQASWTILKATEAKI